MSGVLGPGFFHCKSLFCCAASCPKPLIRQGFLNYTHKLSVKVGTSGGGNEQHGGKEKSFFHSLKLSGAPPETEPPPRLRAAKSLQRRRFEGFLRAERPGPVSKLKKQPLKRKSGENAPAFSFEAILLRDTARRKGRAYCFLSGLFELKSL